MLHTFSSKYFHAPVPGSNLATARSLSRSILSSFVANHTSVGGFFALKSASITKHLLCRCATIRHVLIGGILNNVHHPKAAQQGEPTNSAREFYRYHWGVRAPEAPKSYADDVFQVNIITQTSHSCLEINFGLFSEAFQIFAP